MYMDEFRLGHGAQSTDREREREGKRKVATVATVTVMLEMVLRRKVGTQRRVEVVPNSGGMVKLLSIPQASQISFTLPLQPF